MFLLLVGNPYFKNMPEHEVESMNTGTNGRTEVASKKIQIWNRNLKHILCTSGAVYGCLEIHLDFIKDVCFYIISLYNGLADQWGRGGGQRTRDH